tara:strand:- start:7018 stop:8193 length:1176 start_codon:yes stop_codon:yes gene_type:complete
MIIRILCFTGYYLPAYKAGGPVKTIKNMVEHLPKMKFSIVTRDRDLHDLNSFDNVKVDEWQKTQNADVIYLSHAKKSIFKVAKIVDKHRFDVLYLNSFFDFDFSIKPLLAIKLGFSEPCPIVLAPRGEFSKGALVLKSLKKKVFIKIVSWFGLYKDVIWQASSEYEKQDIIDALSVHSDSVFVAKDLPAKLDGSSIVANYEPSEELRVVFLSRISPMKNLDFSLGTLAFVKSKVVFDIYGPKEDKEYWDRCSSLIKLLPANISVNYCGTVMPEQVGDIFSSYDLFFFPTHGENYGHVIAEALSVGTPVLISDQTPWRNLEQDDLGWDYRLNSQDLFVARIESLARMSPSKRLSYRKVVIQNGMRRVNCDDDITKNKALFEFAVKKFNEKQG